VNPFVPDSVLPNGLPNDARAPSSAGDLVGRAAELDRLLSFIAPIFSGRFAGVVYVDGEAGLGKSHLVKTARRLLEARAAPFLWIEAPCDPTLQRSLNAFEAALEDRFQSLLPGKDERLSPRSRFDRTLAAMAAWVRAESMARPVILHLEDAHWADGDTLRAVQAIVRLSTSDRILPIAVVCTARSTDDGAVPYPPRSGPAGARHRPRPATGGGHRPYRGERQRAPPPRRLPPRARRRRGR
jgi:hypothetical protein